MNQFSIYCTEEQTKKALNLGAPIITSNSPFMVCCTLDNNGYAVIPTVEQMIGWLDEVLPEIYNIAIEYKIEKRKWVYFIGWRESEPIYNSRSEATLAAIDAAIRYLK